MKSMACLLATILLIVIFWALQGEDLKPPSPSKGKNSSDTSLKKRKLVHETYIYGQKTFVSGSTAALRIAIKGAKSLNKSIPVTDAKVTIFLSSKEEGLQTIFEGKTDPKGNVSAQFQLPDLPTGTYVMTIATSSSYGNDWIKKKIKLVKKEKILLVTDKPLYQPGQVIHIRALALKEFTLEPVAGKKILFEVTDSKGNKIFKKRISSSKYGIGSLDFQLAGEVNMGSYRILAQMGKVKAEKMVTVKKYVLPKFKIGLTTTKNYFLPKETVKGKIQADYFFGKALSGGTVKLMASTFDVKFRDFFKLKGTTDQNGTFSFEFPLPAYFVGQPLLKGKGLLKITVEVTDKADHTQKKISTYPVSPQALRITALPESGKLVPDLPNRVFVVASYPDSRPASGAKIYLKTPSKGHFEAITDSAGIATVVLTPKMGNFAWKSIPGKYIHHGRRRVWRPARRISVLVVGIKAVSKEGEKGEKKMFLALEPTKDNILLRPNQAIYQRGQNIELDILSTFQSGTVYLDIIKNRQLLLTKMVELKKGRGHLSLSATSDLFGTLEIHSYKLLPSGTYIRDTRMIYVHPSSTIKIAIQPDKKEYRPGEKATFQITTTDAKGNPLPSALGLTMVDEAVYALQEIQPGLEKIYFTLEKELSKPKYQIENGPGESLSALVMTRKKLEASRQKAGQILFSKVESLTSYSWNRNPQKQRLQGLKNKLWHIYKGLSQYAKKSPVTRMGPNTKLGFQPALLQKLVAKKHLASSYLVNPLGGQFTLEELAKLDPLFSLSTWAKIETSGKIKKIYQAIQKYWNRMGRKKSCEKITLQDLVQNNDLSSGDLVDSWGNPLDRTIDPKSKQWYYYWPLRNIVISSPGADGRLGTADDIHLIQSYQLLRQLAKAGHSLSAQFNIGKLLRPKKAPKIWRARGILKGRMRILSRKMRALPSANAGIPEKLSGGGNKLAVGPSPSSTAPPRIRKYFPETLLFQPQLITDNKGRATLSLSMADSITTWRLTASANSLGGQLGGTSLPIRVFQDFFVDIDFPVALTQNDIISVPVAIYNYLPTTQKVRLVVQKGSWFELLEKGEKTVTMKAKDVAVVYFRLKAKQIGNQSLTVMAYGSKLSDAVRRQVEVVPDGKKIEQVINGRLSKSLLHQITIPQNSIPGSAKIIVKAYPGVGAVLVEGLSGLIRLPGG